MNRAMVLCTDDDKRSGSQCCSALRLRLITPHAGVQQVPSVGWVITDAADTITEGWAAKDRAKTSAARCPMR